MSGENQFVSQAQFQQMSSFIQHQSSTIDSLQNLVTEQQAALTLALNKIEELKAAAKAKAEKKAGKQALKNVWNNFMDMSYSNTRVSVPKADRLKRYQKRIKRKTDYNITIDKKWDNLMRLNIGEEPKQKSHEERLEKYMVEKEGKQLLKIENPSRIVFDFRLMTPKVKHYVLSHLMDFITELFDMIDFNDRWLVHYQFESKWRARPLNSDTKAYFLNQLTKEGYLDQTFSDYDMAPEDYDFFPVNIKQIMQLGFFNHDKFQFDSHKGKSSTTGISKQRFKNKTDYKIYRKMVNSNADTTLVNNFVKENTMEQRGPYTKVEGSFWSWTLNCQFINLDRQMIFHRLNKENAELVKKDNCLIYACKVAGVDETILDAMRGDIVTRTFGLTKLKIIANTFNLNFIVRDARGDIHRYYSDNDSKTTVRLLLYKNHYMLDEELPISPFAIKHWKEIMENTATKYLTREKKLLITRVRGKCVNCDYKLYSLKKIIDAIFSIDGFTKIRLGDYMTFSTLMFKQKLGELTNLNYSEKFSCRLKQCKTK